MTCLALAIGILGFAAMRRAHHRCHGHAGYGWHGPYGYGDHGRDHRGFRGRRGRWMVHALLSRLDASPAQERAILGELDKLWDRLDGVKGGMKDARGDLAAAMRGPVLDDAALGAVLGRLDAATGDARSAMTETLRSIHGLLDDRQRAQVADLLDQGGGWFRGGFGPYR
jgi:Spy/CpxP family protein refolding chaperone